MAKKNENQIESVLDLNSNNIWSVDAEQIARMWEDDKKDEDFATSEDKVLNIIRLAFEVVHFNKDDKREDEKYNNGDWVIFSHTSEKKGSVAIKRKYIKRLTDLSYENIRHITAATLLELIDRNFGGGWDSIPLSVKDIIESGFDISTTQLPASRIHAAGGTLERKVNAGFEVLEIAKGNWTEAIFAKKKEPIEKMHYNNGKYDEEGNLMDESDEDVDEELEIDNNSSNDDDELSSSEDLYSCFSEEAVEKNEDEEGFPVEE